MNNFACIRLLAAGTVVLGHAFVLTGHSAPRLLGWPIHELAVRVFFVVSGYLILASWRRDPDLARFATRRALRIMPGLCAVVLLTVGVLGPVLTRLPIGAYVAHPETADYLWNLALSPRFALPGVFDDGRVFSAVNGSLWSLPVEVAMYALLPFYAGTAGLSRVVLPVVAIGSVVVALVFTIALPDRVEPVVAGTSIPFGLRYAADFVLGAAVRAWRLERFLTVPAALLLAVAAQACASWTMLGGAWVSGVVSAVAVPAVVLACGLARWPVASAFDGRADLSYGVYLWGGPLLQIVLTVLGPGAGPTSVFALAMPLIIALAYLSWRWVEAPALRWKPGVAGLTRAGLSDDRRIGQVVAVVERPALAGKQP